MEQSIFDQIRNDPKYTPARSIDWFKRKVNELGENSPTAKTDLYKTNKEKITNRILPGTMYFFSYDPKYKQELPYYDMFPLTLVFGLETNGFIGINFHYLPYRIRGVLYDKLAGILTKYKTDPYRVLRLNWQLLSNAAKFPEVRPAVKRYLYTNVRSKYLRVPVDDWKTALFLPNEKFAKKSQSFIARAVGMNITNIAHHHVSGDH